MAVRPLPRSERMSLAIGLPLRNQEELDGFLKDVSDPASPNFRRYLTSAQFADRFGPSEADYQALAAFLEANGLAVTGTHPNRMILDVSGSVADVESTFHLNMMTWRHPTRGEFFAPDREPSLDAGVTILDITGLDNFTVARPMDLKFHPFNAATPLTTGSGPAGLFTGNDFRSAYAPGVALNGSGQTVGLFELDGFYASDVLANFQQAGLPPVPTRTVLLDGFSGNPGSANVEVTLDIMMAAYMDPGLNNIIIYEGTNWNDVLNRMATDNLASQLSSSWSFSPVNATTEQIFSEMIAQGQSLFQASGDNGAYKDWIMPPADDPNVTVVGGTSLTTAGAGGLWQSETAWAHSGGGFSTTWPIPSYQVAANVAAAGGSTAMRNIPDVALLADVQIFLVCNNGQWIEVGGTSAAAPLWAGFLALANQQATASGKPAVGFLNPTIYAIGKGSSYQNDLHDITQGSNGFNALPGYDLVTGWGSPTGQNLINDLTRMSDTAGFGLSSSASTLSIADGASGSSTITISPQNGFSGAVNLAASGLPAGVTASFSPATATTSSTLTLTASSSAAPASSTIAITGTSGNLVSATRLQLTVTALSAFTIAASPASLNLAPGAKTTSTITISPQNGFNAAVTLAASGLPAGVSASFSAASANKPGTLTLTANHSATLGVSTITITATSGSLSSTTAVSLTVAPPPSFTMTASPASLGILKGASGISTITPVPVNGFDGTVDISATHLPFGVTATFSPAAQTPGMTLTLNVGANASTGSATVKITGTSGSLTKTVTIALTITPQPSFSLGVTPASLRVSPGGGGSSNITVSPQHGFDGTVVLAASGLPAGVTATFGAMTAGKSGVTFTAATTAVAGTSTVTITGTSGDLTQTTTIALRITPPPSFALTATATRLSVTAGGKGKSTTIAIAAQYGFDGAVAFTSSGLPPGVTVTFGAVTAGRSVVTFTAASSAAPGVSNVTITGTSGGVDQSSTIILTVLP